MMWRRLLPVLGLLVLSILFYWKLSLSEEYVWFDHPDMCYIEIPRLQMQAREFHNGRFALWDPYIWMGQPLIGQTQPGPLFPLNLLFGLLPLKDGYIQFRYLNWYWVLVHSIAVLCAYALCRDLHRSRIASATAAMAFAFGGFITSAAWLDVINGAIWTPVICLFFLRAARGRRPWTNAALCGGLLGLAWLSGHHEVPMMLSYSLAIAWVFIIWRRGLRNVWPAGVTFVIAGLVAAMQLWPTAEFARLSERWVGLDRSLKWADSIPYIAPTTYSMPVKALLGMVLDDSRTYGDSTPYMGVAICALAILGIATGWRRPQVRGMTALLIGGTIFAMGALTPVHGLLYSLAPLLGKARVPIRAVHLVNFALIVLAAYGLDRALARSRGAWMRGVKFVLAAMAGLILAAAIWRRDVPDSMQWGAFVAIACVITLHAARRPRVSRAALGAALLCIVMFEIYPVATAKLANRNDKQAFQFVRTLTDNRDVVDFLRREPYPRRVTVNDQDIPTNFGDWHGIDMMEGYLAGVTSNLVRFGRHTSGVQNVLGITHHVGRTADKPEQVEAFTGASGVKVFRNPSALPRAWAVHRTQTVAEAGQIGYYLDQPAFNARQTALIVGTAPALESCEPGAVGVTTYAPNRIRLHASMNCRGLVNVSDTFYPGWKAAVDGRETPIIETFGALRGIVVDKGEHQIELVFQPSSVYGGIALTLTGLLLMAAIAATEWFFLRRRANPAPAAQSA